MSLRVWVSLGSLFAAGTAFAQAPGEYAAPPPQVAPAPPPPPPAPRQEHRFSIGVGVGQMELTPDGYDDQRQTFDVGELALRYRPWRHLEVELSFGGGHEYLEGGDEGSSAVAWGTLAARYRFNPQDHWNWWLLAGFGQTTVALRGSTSDEIDAAARTHGVLGVGIERRWEHFALQFELRAIAAGATQADRDLEDQYGYATGPGLSGGQFSLGAGYYF